MNVTSDPALGSAALRYLHICCSALCFIRDVVWVIFGLTIVGVVCEPVAAQTARRVEEERIPVAERQRLDLIAPPAKVAGFLVDLRVLNTTEVYQDRTAADASIEEVLVSLGSEVRVRREATTYFLDITGGVSKDISLVSRSGKSRYLFLANVGHRYGEENFVQVRIDLRKRREDPTGISDVIDPVSLYTSRRSFEALARHTFNRLTMHASAASSQVTHLGPEQARYSENKIQLAPTYKLSGAVDLLSEIYARRVSSSFANQGSSSSSGALVGARFDDGIWRAELAAGPQQQVFANGTNRISLGLRGHLRWNPTRLTTLQLDAGTQGGSRAEFGGLASVTTSVVLALDHELRRDLVVSLAGEVRSDQFDVLGRSDKSIRASAGITYWATRAWLVRARAERFRRRSDDPIGRFERSRVFVSFERSI